MQQRPLSRGQPPLPSTPCPPHPALHTTLSSPLSPLTPAPHTLSPPHTFSPLVATTCGSAPIAQCPPNLPPTPQLYPTLCPRPLPLYPSVATTRGAAPAACACWTAASHTLPPRASLPVSHTLPLPCALFPLPPCSNDTWFSANRLCLLDRGFVFAIVSGCWLALMVHI